MKNCLLMMLSCSTFILFGCKKDATPLPVENSPANQTTGYVTKQIFIEPWGAADASTEVTGLAYDSTNDQLFWTKCRSRYNNEIMRYNIATEQYDYVYSYQSQFDYGLRIVANDLWLVRTYDTTIVKLSSLSNYPITVQSTYLPGGVPPSLHNVNDLAIIGGNMYLVSGNFLSIPTYNGLLCSRGPNFYRIEHVTQEVWPKSSYVDSRSIVGVGNNLAIATGDSGAIELRTLSGTLVNTQAGYGNSYLQVDSRNRIYSMQTYPPPLKIIRWSTDLTSKEEFPISTSPSLVGSFHPLFIVREKKADTVDVIMTVYRGTSSPVFQMASLPK